MQTGVFTPTHATGILIADIIPYAGRYDTRLGRERCVVAQTPLFVRPMCWTDHSATDGEAAFAQHFVDIQAFRCTASGDDCNGLDKDLCVRRSTHAVRAHMPGRLTHKG